MSVWVDMTGSPLLSTISCPACNPIRNWAVFGRIGAKMVLREREKQLLIDYLCSNAGGPVYYTGRNMKLSHEGMEISESDWSVFLGHAGDTMAALSVPAQECDDVVAFVLSLKDDIVES
jgi:hypothetical protein